MVAEIGHFALILGFLLSLVQLAVPLAGAHMGWRAWMRMAAPAAIAIFALVAVSFACLLRAFLESDFSVRLVALNSHSEKPLLYKLAGVWGNHEGSLLLWVLILTLFGALVAAFGKRLPLELKSRTLAVQSGIGAAFLAYMLFASNPFLRASPAPLDGNGLNPLLQDPGLAFHPPFLYLGYVGLSVAFSFAAAALIEGRVDSAWARWVRPWTLVAWMFLTIGIALGSWWAYYELGWGGWWFWDPVENASFMPWLVSIALFHCAAVVEKRECLKSWVLLLSIMAFAFSLVGTFIVRSGVITSVHAFASDPERGVFILAILSLVTGGALVLYVYRAPGLEARGVFSTVSRESALIMNNMLLVVAALVVFIGTLWPLLAELAFGRVLSVGPPYFNKALAPFAVAIAALLPLGAMLPWKRGELARAMAPLRGALALSAALGCLVWSLQSGRSILGPAGVLLACWIVAGSASEILQRARFGKAGLGESLRRVARLPGGDIGKAVGHAGFGLCVFGIAAVTAYESEEVRAVRIGEPYSLAGYEFRLDSVESVRGPNYSALRGRVVVSRGGREVAELWPEKRHYPVAKTTTTEAAIDQGLLRDVYVALGERQPDGSWVVRSYVKPFVNWIWIGAFVMAAGGALSLADRRHRLAAGRQRREMGESAGREAAPPA